MNKPSKVLISVVIAALAAASSASATQPTDNVASDGAGNTAVGAFALSDNTSGSGNTATVVYTLTYSVTGANNSAIGEAALQFNGPGNNNTAFGVNALNGNDDGYGNAAQGFNALIIKAYIAGVATSPVTGSAVYVNSSGQLGVLASSERFKTDVQSMDDASDKLAQLRPVTFKLKSDPGGTIQFGLIAEENASIDTCT